MIARIYTGPDNKTHLEEFRLPPEDVDISALQTAAGILFRRFPAGTSMDWHNAPRRQYIITLEGQVEIGLGDGSVRRFGPGDVLLAEDLTGQGHTTRVIGDDSRLAAMVRLPE